LRRTIISLFIDCTTYGGSVNSVEIATVIESGFICAEYNPFFHEYARKIYMLVLAFIWYL